MGWGRPGNEADLLVSKARLSVPVFYLTETGAASLGSRLLTFPLPPHTTAFPNLIPSPPQPSLVTLHDGLGMGLPPPLYISSSSCVLPITPLSFTLPLPHTPSPSHSPLPCLYCCSPQNTFERGSSHTEVSDGADLSTQRNTEELVGQT